MILKFHLLKKPEVGIGLVVGLTVFMFAAGFWGKWPLVIQFFPLGQFLRWTLTAMYLSVPVIVTGHWVTRKILRWHFIASPTWLLLIDWTIGWAMVVIMGTALLGVGLYSGWIWMVFALFINLAVVFWLFRRQWQPIVSLWKETLPELRENFLGETTGPGRKWNILVLVLFLLAFLHAVLLPNTRDELAYHLVLPQLWELQQHWWVTPDNYHLLFPANMEIIWGYALAIGGLHLPRLMTFLFGVMTVGAMRQWLKDSNFDPWTRGISVAFFLITPLVLIPLSITYVEWPLLFFIFLGYWASEHYLQSGQRKYLGLTAITWGLSLGMKYSAIPIIGLLGVEWLFYLSRRRSIRYALTASLIVFIGGLVFAGPWCLRNYLLTQDPIYPLGKLLTFQDSHPVPDDSLHIDYLTRNENLTGGWRWNPWLYHTSIDRTSDNRMHPGWLFLHLAILLFGWKFRRIGAWLTVVILSLVFFYFTPAPRIYFPLMGLSWLFLPYYLSLVHQRRRIRVIISGLMVLFTIPSLSMILHFEFMTYNRASQDYFLGLIDDQTVLRKDGIITPVIEWVRDKTPEDSRIWVWCDDKVFYFSRWARASSPYDLPVFLNIVSTQGVQALSREITKDHINYIAVNTSRCSLPLEFVKTEKMTRPVSEDLRNQLDGWMKQSLNPVVKDHQFELYQVHN